MGRVPLQELKSEVVESIEVGFEEEKRERDLFFLKESVRLDVDRVPRVTYDF